MDIYPYTEGWVLILVVVEDVLVLLGYTTNNIQQTVLILVVVEDVLVHDGVWLIKKLVPVLILVVVEDVLVRIELTPDGRVPKS